MYDLAGIKTLLETGLSYKIEFAKTVQPVLITDALNPTIYVGYEGIKSNFDINGDILDIGGQDLKQTFQIIIFCLHANLPTIWREIYVSLNTKNTQPLEDNFSGLTYNEGGILSLEGDNIWWIDKWLVSFPTLNTF